MVVGIFIFPNLDAGNISYKMDLNKREDRLWTHIGTYKSSIYID